MSQRSGNIVRRARAARLVRVCALAAAWTLSPVVALAQLPNPVYVNDAPAATEALARALDLARSGNRDEAARVLQRVLDGDDGKVIARVDDPDAWVAVRARVHDALLADGPLLESYRRQEQPAAARAMEDGARAAAGPLDAAVEVERTRLLTTAGLEACLRVAQARLERGAFESSWHALLQLERHPDRAGPAGSDCATLLTLVAGYLDRAEVWDVAARWRSEAGLAPAERVRASAPARTSGRTPLDPASGPIDLVDLVSRPLTSEKLSIDLSMPDSGSAQSRAPDEPPAQARLLLSEPTVAGDTIFVNDGQAVTALDRFTLEVRWRTSFENLPLATRTQAVNAGSRMIEDLCAVTVSDSWLIATTGIAMMGERRGDQRVHAMDAGTGVRRWSVDVAALGPELSEASVRGPAIVDQGVVVVSTLTRSRLRRLTSVHLVGLDLGTGALRWHTPLASVGSLSYPNSSQFTDGCANEAGIVYLCDRIGFAAAVETATGRLRWLRRMAGDQSVAANDNAWLKNIPQLRDGRVYTLAPDRRSILVLDGATGATLTERSVSDLDRPRYLLLAGADLLAVGERTVSALALATLGDSERPARTVLRRPDLRARVMVAGDRVLASTTMGLVSTALSGTEAISHRLDSPGAALPLDGQVVVVDDGAVHTYLVWSRAERILRDRLAADPSDAAPGAALAELAHRAARTDQVLPAVDAALRAIEAQPTTARNQASRRRLFQSAIAMVDPDPAQPGGPPLPESVAAPLLERIARLATSPDERVRHLLAVAEQRERAGQPRATVEALQSVLDEQALATATVVRHGTSFLAESEATRRLQMAIQEHGRDVYARYDAEAERERAQLPPDGDPAAFAALARRYPVSRAAAKLWLSAANSYGARGSRQSALFALEKGLRAAEDGLDASDSAVGELAGRLVQELARDDRLAAAGATLARVVERWPGAQLTENGQPLNLVSLRDTISSRLALLQRRPRVGSRLGDRAMLLAGWTIARPILSAEAGPSAEFVTLASLATDEIGLFAPDAGGGVRKLWATHADDDTSVLRIDAQSVYLVCSADRGPEIARLDLTTGRQAWRTKPFRELIAPADRDAENRAGADQPQGARPPLVDTPLQARRALSEVVIACDGRILAMVERSGRALGLDLDSGQVLWTRTDTMPVVFDAAAGAGILALGGADPTVLNARAQARPRLMTLDLRSGRTLHDLPTEAGAIRWIRMTPDAGLIAGMDQGVGAFDLFQGRQRWLTGGAHTRLSLDAWNFPGRVLVLNGRGQLAQLELDTGAISREALDSTDRLGVLEEVRVRTVDDRAVFLTPRGVGIYARDGALLGMDHRADEGTLTPGELGDDCIIAIEDAPDSGEEEQPPRYGLNIFTLASASLVERRQVALGSHPRALALIDGRILITAGDATLVIDAPRP